MVCEVTLNLLKNVIKSMYFVIGEILSFHMSYRIFVIVVLEMLAEKLLEGKKQEYTRRMHSITLVGLRNLVDGIK